LGTRQKYGQNWLVSSADEAAKVIAAAGVSARSRVGPFGEVPGASKLVQVRFLEPVYQTESVTVGLRWEAIGLSGGLFPVLDADISLARDGEQMTRLALVGAYRPPFGRLGAGLDGAILNRVAV
jgi:hypothetical protein